MSERVVPTKPGWWWCAWGPIFNEVCLFVEFEESPELSKHGIITQRPGDEEWCCAMNKEFQWLAPVPSAGAVQAAIDAMRTADEIAAWAARHGLWCTTGFREVNRNAIAGLTGGEG